MSYSSLGLDERDSSSSKGTRSVLGATTRPRAKPLEQPKTMVRKNDLNSLPMNQQLFHGKGDTSRPGIIGLVEATRKARLEARVGVGTTVISDDNFLRLGGSWTRRMREVVGGQDGSAMLAQFHFPGLFCVGLPSYRGCL